MSGILLSGGAREAKEVRYAPIYTNRMFTGLWTQRNPLRDPSAVAYEKYYGGRTDALLSGQNVELTNRLTLARRPGNSAYSIATFSEAVNSFYSFKQFSTNSQTITLLADTPNYIYSLTPLAKTALYTKGSSSNTFGCSYLGVGNTLFIGFNNSSDQPKAWEGGVTSVRNWGISAAASGGSSAGTAVSGSQSSTVSGGPGSSGPVYPGTAGTGGGGTGSFSGPWSTPSNIEAEDGVCSTWAFSSRDGFINTDYLQGTNFGFSLPSTATITGVVAEVKHAQTPSYAGGNPSTAVSSVLLIKGGSRTGTDHNDSANLPDISVSGLTWITYGSVADDWGAGLTVSDVNASDFGFAVQYIGADDGNDEIGIAVDAFRITVYYTTPNVTWTSPANIAGAVGHGSPNYTTTTPVTGVNSPQLYATQYGFAVANGVVGVTVAIYGHVSSSSGSPQLTVQLRDNNGNPIGSQKTISFTNTSDGTATLGSSTDVWGAALTPGIVNGASFGAIIVASGTSPTFSLNACTITVYTNATPGATPSGAGAFSGTYRYAYSYANSNVTDVKGNPVVSNIVGGSVTATPAGNTQVAVSVVASSDTQVNQIILWRSVASGSTLYYLGAYANATASLVDLATADSALDTTRQAAAAYQLTPPTQNLHGQVYHASRIWGIDGNVVYYSSGPDLGNIYGNGNEGFPPANYFVFPNKVTRIVAVAQGLLVFTVGDVWIITGNASATGLTQVVNSTGLTLFNAQPIIADFGLLSPNALDVNGSTIYLFTSDKQFLSIDVGAGVSEIGFPIGGPSLSFPYDTTLASLNPATAYVSWLVIGSQEKAVYVSDGSTGWFRCNPVLPPDGTAVWSPKATIAAGCKAVQAIETSVGSRSLLIGPGSSGGSVLVRNTNVFTDNGSAYSADFTMGSFNLAEPGQIAEVGFVTADFSHTGTTPAVSVLLNELSGTFTDISDYVHSDPPALYGAAGQPTTMYSNRYDLSQSIAANSDLHPLTALCRHMQIEVDFGTDSVQNEMLGIGIFGTVYQEK